MSTWTVRIMALSTAKHKALTTLFFAAGIFYLGFHTIHGEQGLYALLVESYRQEKLEAELAELKSKRLFLEHKVSLMRDDSLDPDLLDEEARRLLGYVAEGELVMLNTHK